MLEIERKFLVKSEEYKTQANKRTKIVQGFLNSHPERTVRVRIFGEQGFLTIKGKSNASGLSRFEWEKQISLAEAEELMNLCESGIIEKTRFEVSMGDHVFEVDEFLGDNEGLTVAEVELKSETESFQKPSWLGEEVTGELKYYNSNLSNNAFKFWNEH